MEQEADDKNFEYWDVKLYFERSPGSSWESGISSRWPTGTSITDIIADVALIRNVDLTKCHSVEAKKCNR